MKYAKKTDFYIIIPILIISAAFLLVFYFSQNNHTIAHIYSGENEVFTIILDDNKEETFVAIENPNVIFYKTADGKIRFEKSDCPDKICINSGFLSKVGQTAACIPNKSFLVITSNRKSAKNADVIVG